METHNIDSEKHCEINIQQNIHLSTENQNAIKYYVSLHVRESYERKDCQMKLNTLAFRLKLYIQVHFHSGSYLIFYPEQREERIPEGQSRHRPKI